MDINEQLRNQEALIAEEQLSARRSEALRAIESLGGLIQEAGSLLVQTNFPRDTNDFYRKGGEYIKPVWIANKSIAAWHLSNSGDEGYIATHAYIAADGRLIEYSELRSGEIGVYRDYMEYVAEVLATYYNNPNDFWSHRIFSIQSDVARLQDFINELKKII